MVKTAVFGGGCFWCTEAIFQQLKGVVSVTPGYAGGHKNNPSYQEVSNEHTGHAEVIKINFNPKEITYEDLLRIFFTMHDPTTRNRQGADVGSQYRSIILYTSPQQKKEAQEYKRALEQKKAFNDSLTTEIQPLKKFFDAEEYHRDYYKKNEQTPYCQLMITPKLQKLREKFGSKLRR